MKFAKRCLTCLSYLGLSAFLSVAVLFCPLLQSAHGQAETVVGLKVPDGFVATQVANDALATDVYCLAVSPRGDTFVSGPGYLKVLIDGDNDGIFDSSRLFASGPRSGAQGICFDGNDLLCVGDGGLWRYVDADGNGFADGLPEMLFPIKTGGEHLGHAIRQGPDGWWYVLAGNQTPILKEYYADPNSPVTQPRAGFLMRISPDWQRKQIVTHGFRNAYDFDFNSRGQIFVYDSDGERDISLPWYRPTRLFQMRPGDDAGWVDAGWKRPDTLFDMPPVVGALGRGSPTGVVVAHSKQFPAEFDDAIFVADWTFGRVMVFRPANSNDDSPGGTKYQPGMEFAVASGQFGFAVTDLDFAFDGSLLISVGGRGTQGGVYRVSFQSPPTDSPPSESLQPPSDLVLDAEIRLRSAQVSRQQLLDGLADPSQSVRAAALEGLVGRRDILGTNAGLNQQHQQILFTGLRKSLASDQPKTMGLAIRIIRELAPALAQQIDDGSLESEARLGLQLALARTDDQKRSLIQSVAQQLSATENKPLVGRIGQLALGGCGEDQAPQMFVGYTPRAPLSFERPVSEELGRVLARVIDDTLDQSKSSAEFSQDVDEVGRFAAMLRCESRDLQSSIAHVLRKFDADPVNDIHWLNCLSQIHPRGNPGFENEVRLQVAQTLTQLNGKIDNRRLNIDRNFNPRLRTLAQKLFQIGGEGLTVEVAGRISGNADDLFLYEAMPDFARDVARLRFANAVSRAPEDVTGGQIRILAEDRTGQYVPLIRQFSNTPQLQAAVIEALSRSPQRADREVFIEGLESYDPGTVKRAAIALRRLFEQPNVTELIAALSAARRLGWDKPSVSVRDQLSLLIERHCGQAFGYQPKLAGVEQSDVVNRWMAWAEENAPNEYAREFERRGVPGLKQRLTAIDWNVGRVARGKAIYQTLQCAQCHDSGARLGPRLEGVTNRFGREDLFRAIMTPNEQVPDRYRAMMVETVDGQLFTGSVVYESVDGITLQETSGNTVRINRKDIEAQDLSPNSMMPDGLLDHSSDHDFADLFAYLSSLK